jgi:hypothetical protein
LYSTAVPEQQAFGEVVSVSGPTQVQMPFVQVPEKHAWLSVQAAPLWSVPATAHVPAAQRLDWHASSPVHAAPFACFAAQVPASQKPDWQSPSPEHVVPFGRGPQNPAAHVLFGFRHSAVLEQG